MMWNMGGILVFFWSFSFKKWDATINNRPKTWNAQWIWNINGRWWDIFGGFFRMADFH